MSYWKSCKFIDCYVTRQVSLVGQELLTLPEHQSSPPVFSVLSVLRYTDSDYPFFFLFFLFSFFINCFVNFHFFILQTTHSSHHMHRTRQTYYKCKWQLLLFVCSAHNHFFLKSIVIVITTLFPINHYLFINI